MTITGESSLLHAARFDWQSGDWQALADLPVSLPAPPAPGTDAGAEPGTPPGAVTLELLLYRLQALFQLHRTEEGKALASGLVRAGVSRRKLQTALLSGAISNTAAAWQVLGRPDAARTALRKAVALNPASGTADKVAGLRLRTLAGALRQIPDLAKATGKGLFIDCGGYDGCSALKFLVTAPGFDCVTFEPNPALWRYYEGLPTQLIGKAAYTHDGEVDFTVDPVDGDGSTLMRGKRIDALGTVADSDCPVLRVPCVDLPAFVRRMAATYDTIVLKLDVEGAEYDILERMLEGGEILLVSRILCEFHHDKLPMPKARHDGLLARIRAILPIEAWDASHAPFKVAPKDNTSDIELRRRLVTGIATARRKLTKIQW